MFLRTDVCEYAQAVSHKAEQQGERDVFCGEVHFACGKRNDDGTDSRTEAFYGHNLVCAFVRNFAGAVVFEPPADGCAENEDGADRKIETVGVFERKNETGYRYK